MTGLGRDIGAFAFGIVIGWLSALQRQSGSVQAALLSIAPLAASICVAGAAAPTAAAGWAAGRVAHAALRGLLRTMVGDGR